MHKDYIESQYKTAVSDYRLARDDADRNDALRRMAKLEQIAATTYGFEYADKLHNTLDESGETQSRRRRSTR